MGDMFLVQFNYSLSIFGMRGYKAWHATYATTI